MEQQQHPSKAAQARSKSLSEVARLLGKSRATITRWVDQGAPTVQVARREDGVEWRLDLGALLDWHARRAVESERARLEDAHHGEIDRLERALAEQDDDDEPMSRTEALRRKAVVEATLREIDLAERSGDVASVDGLTTALVNLFTALRTRFLHLAAYLAPQVAGESSEPECQRLIDDAIRETLTRFADSSAEELVEHAAQETQARARAVR